LSQKTSLPMDGESHGVWQRSNSSPLPHSVDRFAGNSVGRSVSLQSAETGGGLSVAVPSLAPRHEFQCRICLQHCDHCIQRSFKDCPVPTLHAVCEHCLRCYLTGRINERKVKQLQCPLYGREGCTAEIRNEDLQVLPEAILQKYQRFKAMEEDPTLRECPECQELVKPAMLPCEDLEAEVLGIQSAMSCSQGHQFCYYHSNAHPIGEGFCEEYAQREAEASREAMASQGAKQCPRCQTQILKHDGCNHMVCLACQCHWCWTCGTDLTGRLNLGWHYNPANPNGCMQFSALEKNNASKLTLLARAIALPGAILGFLIFWSTLPLWIVCGLGVLVAVVALLLVGCAWCSATIPCVCGLCCLGLTDAQAELILCAPCHSCWASVECLLGGLEPEQV